MLILQYKNGLAFDATYVQETGSLPQPIRDIYIRSDGLKMFSFQPTHPSNGTLREYTLSVAWDISTISFVDSYNVSGPAPGLHGFTFKTDGTRFYQVDANVPRRYREFNLPVAWDLDTVTTGNTKSAPWSVLHGIEFKDDGMKMFTTYSGDDIAGWDLSTPWDITTAVLDGNTYIFPYSPNNFGFHINSTGTKLYHTERDGPNIHRFTMSTPWDVSTLSLDHTESISADTDGVHAIFVKPDETRMYVVMNGVSTAGAIGEYTIT